MLRRMVLAAGLVGLAAFPAAAQDKSDAAAKADKAKPATTEAVLAALRTPVTHEGTVNDVPLSELLNNLGKRCDVTFVVRTELFKAEGEPNVTDRRPELAATRLENIPLRRFLDLILPGMNATYLVRKGVIEIVPTAVAARETKNGETVEDGEARVQLREPLVSAIYKEKPLTEAVAELADEFDLTVVVAPQAADNRAAFVSARLLNVPADRALELLAVQADLRVVRKGTTYLLTSRDHANEMFAEREERERQKIETEKLRRESTAPPAAPKPTPDGK